MQDLFDKYGVIALFAYLLIERTFPLLGRALDKIIPAHLRKRKALEERTLELEKEKLEAQKHLDQMKEREV